MYPRREDGRFDFDYYLKSHMKMVKDLAAGKVRAIRVEKSVAGGPPNPYEAIGHIDCDSMADWQAVFDAHGQKFMADVPNFTNIQPVLQVSEVVGEL